MTRIHVARNAIARVGTVGSGTNYVFAMFMDDGVSSDVGNMAFATTSGRTCGHRCGRTCWPTCERNCRRTSERMLLIEAGLSGIRLSCN